MLEPARGAFKPPHCEERGTLRRAHRCCEAGLPTGPPSSPQNQPDSYEHESCYCQFSGERRGWGWGAHREGGGSGKKGVLDGAHYRVSPGWRVPLGRPSPTPHPPC